AFTVVPHPERPFGPREPTVAAGSRRRERREHTPGLRIDLLDAVFGELEQVAAVEGRSRVRGDLDRTHLLAALGVEGIQRAAGGDPDVAAVVGDAAHVVDAWKGSVLPHDFGELGGGLAHAAI